MNLSALFIYRPVATTLLTLAITLAGTLAFFIVPTLQRGNAGVDAPASRNQCEANVFGGEPVFRNAGALRIEFPRRSVGTMYNPPEVIASEGGLR